MQPGEVTVGANEGAPSRRTASSLRGASWRLLGTAAILIGMGVVVGAVESARAGDPPPPRYAGALLRSEPPPAKLPQQHQQPARATYAPGAARGLVIVTPRALWSALDAFVAHKERALPTRRVALEDVLAETDGVDDPERLKRWLWQRWREDGIGYALLVGDADVMPVRYTATDRWTEPAFHTAFYPSDLYYADLAKADGSFDDWNAKRDGHHAHYFGEVRGESNKEGPINLDQIDYLPEIGVGRWPASTPATVATIAAKTIRFEESARRASAAPGARRVALVMQGGWVDARPRFDRMAGWLAPAWQTERLYYKDARRDDGTPPVTEAEVLRVMREGTSIILHAGHGNDHVWEGCLSTRGLLDAGNADRLPILLSAGCSTARFATLPPYEGYVDVHGVEHAGSNHGQVFSAPPPPPAPYQRGKHNPTGLGEQSLVGGPGGAVAYFGCNTGSQPAGISLLDGFARALGAADDAPRLGDLWVAAIWHYHAAERLDALVPTESWYPPAIFHQGTKFMLFGDPSLLLPRPRAAF